MTKKTVLVLGASGKIGSHAAEAFEAAGWTVRRFRRGHEEIAQAAIGADVIINGFNPPAYKNWATLVPQYTTEIIAAARESGATIIVPGNVYVYGEHQGTMDQDTPHRATTRKGNIRIEMEATYRAAANDGVQTIILRAGDFLDPRCEGTVMSLVVLRSVAKGHITTLADPSVQRAHAYVPDWARAAVALAEMRNELSTFEDIPFPGTTFSIEELAHCIETATGRPIRIVKFPWWSLYIASPFWKLAYEMLEMRYLSGLDHTLSAKRFDELLPGFRTCPRTEVMLCELPKELRQLASIAKPTQATQRLS